MFGQSNPSSAEITSLQDFLICIKPLLEQRLPSSPSSPLVMTNKTAGLTLQQPIVSHQNINKKAQSSKF